MHDNFLEINQYDLSNFTWVKETKTLSCFMSDLRDFALKRVWNDACDVGIKIKGKICTVIFTLAQEIVEKGELQYLELVPYRGPGMPQMNVEKLVIFND